MLNPTRDKLWRHVPAGGEGKKPVTTACQDEGCWGCIQLLYDLSWRVKVMIKNRRKSQPTHNSPTTSINSQLISTRRLKISVIKNR